MPENKKVPSESPQIDCPVTNLVVHDEKVKTVENSPAPREEAAP